MARVGAAAEAHVGHRRLDCALAVTQSMPATTCALVPLPWQLSTRTATSCTPLATPYARAADRAGHVRAVPVAVVGRAAVDGVEAAASPGRRSRCG